MMTDKEELLEERKKLKNKKPDFGRTDSHKKKGMNKGWRKPKGLHNKLRLNKRGYGKPVDTGYGSPKAVRGLHPSGLEPVRVHNPSQVEDLEDEEGAVIASQVGDRKRVEIIKTAQENDVEILNLDPQAYLKKVEERLQKQKEEAKEREERKEEREKEGEEKAEDAEEEKVDPEEQKKKEKEEMEKVVTKK